MAEVWLIVVSVIVSLLLCGMSFILLVQYSHPDDKNSAYFPKIVVILSFTLSEVLVLMMALDVANQGGNPLCNRVTIRPLPRANVTTLRPTFSPTVVNFTTDSPTLPSGLNEPNITIPFEYSPPCGDLAIGTMWSAMWFVVAIFVALIIPFNIFFYEANEHGRKFSSKLCEAIQYQGVALVLAGLTLGLMYWQINMFSYPVAVVANDMTLNPPLTCEPGQDYCTSVNVNGANILVYVPNTTNLLVPSSNIVTGDGNQAITLVPNSFGTYLACFLSFIGWWLFCIYTGTGLITLPIDLIKAYLYRPTYIPKDVYIKLREDIRQRLLALMEMGEKMKKERKTYEEGYGGLGYRERYSKSNTQRTMFKEFKKQVMQLEGDYEDIRVCHEAWSSYNPLIPYVKLVGGIISAILSVCWILQILLFILPQYWPTGAAYIPTFFLNDLMTWGLIYSGFSLLGVIFLAIFGLYLLACNVNGNFKIGLKFLIMEIHPMKVGATYMSSFLVNILLLLLQTPALINFLAQSFSNTIVLTDIDLIMNWSARYTTFFVYFFDNNVFIFILLAFIVLSCCLIYAIPDNRKASNKRLKSRLDKMSETINEREKEQNKKVRGLGLKSIVQTAKENDARNQDNAEDADNIEKKNTLSGS